MHSILFVKGFSDSSIDFRQVMYNNGRLVNNNVSHSFTHTHTHYVHVYNHYCIVKTYSNSFAMKLEVMLCVLKIEI